MNAILSNKNNASLFSRYLGLTLAMIVALALAFAYYVYAEKQIDRANELRQQSFVLAEELRQSSDDLAATVRAYVATGNPIFKRHFQEILAIRDGTAPRPLQYQNVYWDIVLNDDLRPRPMGAAVPLLELMRRAGFTEQEFAALAEAKANSDALARTEFAAMNMAESGGAVTDAARLDAIRILQSPAFQRTMADIMRPIGVLQQMVDQRTQEKVHAAKILAIRLRVAFILIGLILVYFLWRTHQSLHKILGCPVNELHERIDLLGSGNFSAPIMITTGAENSVLGWLARTQFNLARVDGQRRHVEDKIQRLSNLYAALSQCSQAVLRCVDQNELFSQVCGDVVAFGGMRIAWIGLINEQRKQLEPVVVQGNGVAYLEDILTSVTSGESFSATLIDIVFRENRPFWCQDFLHDPATAAWYRPGIDPGWQAFAALPLRRNGETIGVLCLHAAEINAFDQVERNLTEELALVISFALDNLVREAARKEAETALRQSEARYRTMQLDHDRGGGERTSIDAAPIAAGIVFRPVDELLFDKPKGVRDLALIRESRRIAQQKLESANAHLARLSAQLIDIQEQERKNIAREMHDELGQRLTLLKISVYHMREFLGEPQALNTWAKIDSAVSGLATQIRTMSGSLRPQTLDYLGLESAIGQLLDNQFANLGVECVFEYAGMPDKVEAPLDITVYRIVQESVTNIVKYARATQVVVEINGGESMVELEVVVSDNGIGFDTGKIKTLESGSVRSGLLGLRERIGLIGGSFDVQSEPGKGARIVASLPLKRIMHA